MLEGCLSPCLHWVLEAFSRLWVLEGSGRKEKMEAEKESQNIIVKPRGEEP